MQSHKTVEAYIASQKQWNRELVTLREILLSTGLKEEIKWGAPIYTYEGKNVVGIAGFKSYFGIWFHQGALLEDPKKKLINAQEGITKALRQWRFSNIEEIDAKLIKSFVKASVHNLKEGKVIKPATNKPLTVPKELNALFKKNSDFHQSFKALSKGKQRDYADYISEAVRPETKAARVAKIIPMIEKGIGLNDKYK